MSTQFTNRQWRLPNEENKSKVSNYSMDFDGINDYIDVTNGEFDFSGNFTVSVWAKWNATGYPTNSTGIIDFNKQSPSNKEIFIGPGFGSNFNNVYIQWDGNGKHYTGLNAGDNQWHNIIVTGTGTNGSIKTYLDGNELTTYSSTSYGVTGGVNVIGKNTAFSGRYFKGSIDGVAIFDYALSSSQVTTLYGSSSTGIGNPMSLSPKPVAFYQLGDKSAFNGANYLAPNIAAEEADGDIATSYSPYALDFDSASSDYINCGNDSSLNTNALTVSCWVKAPAFTPAVGPAIISKDAQSSTNRSFGFLFVYTSFLFQNWDSAGNENRVTISNATIPINTDGQWHHLVATIDGTTNANGIKVYIDNVVVGQATATATGIRTSTVPFFIGGSGSTGSTYSWNGQISNVSYWDVALTSAQVSELYNEGVPSNLNNHSAYSNLVSWWQLGSNSSFNTNWTVLDEKGSNNGTSANMTEDAIVDGVGSSANGLSSGMGGDEVIGDAPYSTANSLSVNMDVEDRVTDTPS